MADEKSWAEQLAAKAAGTASAGEAAPRAGRPAPAWLRLVAARARGEAPDPEDVAAVEKGQRPPRAEWERRLLERLGYSEDDGPSAA
ncbi:hypothetical protein [Streptomyces sp. NPDC005283]|uniref:hypothetical protein n=1 Tax=Streptomyces sp. NPDC005283 TaxID=3156871 RepID=UPI003454A88D